MDVDVGGEWYGIMVVVNGLRGDGAGRCRWMQYGATFGRILTFARVRVWSDETAVVR